MAVHTRCQSLVKVAGLDGLELRWSNSVQEEESLPADGESLVVEGRVRQLPLLWLVVVPSLEGGGAGGGGESHHLPHDGHVELIPAQLCCIGTCCQDVRPGELRRAGTIVHKPAATTELIHCSLLCPINQPLFHQPIRTVIAVLLELTHYFTAHINDHGAICQWRILVC